MKRIILPLFLILLFIAFLFACVSMGTSLQGKNYFVGKSESALTKYFGYNGEEYDGEGVYDKILYFTNLVVTVYMDKTTVTTYKTTTNQNVFSLNYSEHNDGCLVLFENGHYHYRPRTAVTTPEHRNDNAFVRGEFNRFNNEIKRLNAVSSDNQQATLNITPIGSWYFVYRVSQEYYVFNYGISNNDGIPTSETAVIYHCNMWRVNVVADNRSSTETHIAYFYDDLSQQFYNENGNAISQEQANSNEDFYARQGFTTRTQSEGLSVLAYIKNGKVVKVE
jgi:hypothetical protein